MAQGGTGPRRVVARRPRRARRRFRPGWALGAAGLVLGGLSASAVTSVARAEGLEVGGIPAPTSSDFGGIGLQETPTARMGAEGDVRGFTSYEDPYIRFGVSGMLFPWAEITFRMTDITNKPYGPASFSGNQTYLDRGIDARFRLYKEDEYLPDVTLGLRDIAGTGLFDAEYLAASRRWYDWDFTLGLGWGQLASDNMFHNPFASISNHFATRRAAGSAGNFRFDYFSGQSMSLFGGVEYHTPVQGLTVQLAFNSDDYRQGPFNEGASIHVAAPVDFGVVYQPYSWLAVSAGLERGNTAMVKLGLLGNIAAPAGGEYRSPELPPRISPAVAPIPVAPDEAPPPATAAPMPASPDATAAAAAPPSLIRPLPPVTPEPATVPAVPPPPAADLELLASIARSHGWRVLSVSAGNAPRRAAIAPADPGLQGLDQTEAIAEIARGVARIAPRADKVELTIGEDGDARRLTLDSHALEMAVAATGSAAEQVRQAASHALEVPAPPHIVHALDTEIAQAIFADLHRIGFTGESFELRGREAVLAFSQNTYRYPARATGEAARVLLAHVPSEIQLLTFSLRNHGIEMARVSLLRSDIEHAVTGNGSAEEVLHNVDFSGGGDTPVAPPEAVPGSPPAAIPVSPPTEPEGRVATVAIANPDAFPALSYSLHPGLRTQLGGPNGYFLYDLYAGLSGEAQLMPGVSATGELGASLISNFDQLTLPSNSALPHVRSDIADYLRDGRFGIRRLQADAIERLAPDVYGRISGGLLEEMYGGVDAEVLYRPYDQRWAIGFDVNHLWQRGFHEQFGFRSYHVTTGDLEAYYRLPWYGLVANVKVGRYLAGDKGGTIDISREFASGVKVGAFATFTNVSSQQFGEGSFDKGIYISIPLDLLLPIPSRSAFGYTYRPVTRDGGQMLDIDKPLYDETGGYDPDHFRTTWSQLLD